MTKKRITRRTKDLLCDILHRPSFSDVDEETIEKYTKMNESILGSFTINQLEILLNDNRPFAKSYMYGLEGGLNREKWFKWNIKNELHSRLDYKRDKKLKELFG